MHAIVEIRTVSTSAFAKRSVILPAVFASATTVVKTRIFESLVMWIGIIDRMVLATSVLATKTKIQRSYSRMLYKWGIIGTRTKGVQVQIYHSPR